jgi:dCMP deaminase
MKNRMIKRFDEFGRVSWEHIWMETCLSVSKRSPHPTNKVGAIIVSGDNTRVLSIGYNGDYSGGPNELESDIPGMSGFIHAETNAIIKMDYHANCDKKLFVSLSPCKECAKLIINAGIKEVIYNAEYRDSSGIDLLKSNGISVIHI